MEALGVLASFTTVKILAAIAMVLKDLGTAIVILAFGSFVAKKENDEDREDMNGVDFEGVALSNCAVTRVPRRGLDSTSTGCCFAPYAPTG